MDSKQLIGQLFQHLDKDDLVLTSDQFAYRIRKKCDLTLNSRFSGQMLNGADMSDGKRLLITLYEKPTTKITDFFDKVGLVYVVSNDSPTTTIYVHPNADKDLLGIQAQPTHGNVEIIQGEYAITNSINANPFLSTSSISSCTGLLLFDSKLRFGSIAHVDFPQEIALTLDMMVKELDLHGAREFVFGQTSNIDQTEQYLILSKYGERFSDKIELPREFSFDTRTGKVGQYIQSDDPTIHRRFKKTTHRIEDYITTCFSVYALE